MVATSDWVHLPECTSDDCNSSFPVRILATIDNDVVDVNKPACFPAGFASVGEEVWCIDSCQSTRDGDGGGVERLVGGGGS